MIDMKGGIQKLCMMMKKLLENLDKGVRILNLPHLLVQNWTLIHVLDLYNAVQHLFALPSLNKRRRLKTISWKTYYNILSTRKGYLVGDKVPKN